MNFFDSSVICYAYDLSEPSKRDTCLSLFEGAFDGQIKGIISNAHTRLPREYSLGHYFLQIVQLNNILFQVRDSVFQGLEIQRIMRYFSS